MKELIVRTQVNDDYTLVDKWLEGYYAAKSEIFDRDIWDKVLSMTGEENRRELIIRNLICNSPIDKTPNWDELGNYTSEVLSLVAEEWIATDAASRQVILQRFEIPTDENGNINFTSENENLLDECDTIGLLSILNLHCSISDPREFRNGTRNLQWELIFGKLLSENTKPTSEIYPDIISEYLNAKPNYFSKSLNRFQKARNKELSHITKLIPIRIGRSKGHEDTLLNFAVIQFHYYH